MVCALIAASSFSQVQQLVINEAMSANTSGLTDDTDNNEDWIELHNTGGTAVDLAGAGMSDDPAIPMKHVFPASLVVPANGKLIIWASGEPDRGPAHLDFSLSSSGETILLSTSNGQLVDLVSVPDLPMDVSYGRAGDGAPSFLFFAQPTPNAPNASTGFLGQLPAPSFSLASGFYTNTINVSLSHPDAQAVIYYSLDGTIPGPELLGGYIYSYKNQYPSQGMTSTWSAINDTLRAFVYNTPLLLSNPTPQPNFLSRRTTRAQHYYPAEYMPNTIIRKSRVVRARAFRPGYLPSEVVTNTYFFSPDGQSPHALPVISLATSREYLFSHDTGVYNPGIDYEQWRVANPNTMLTGTTPANWTRRTEFPVSFEWFEEGSNTRTFHRNAGFRTHGSYSLSFRRKALRFYFRDEYGHDNVNYPVFLSQDDTDFKRLVMHTSGNDDAHTNLRDMTLQAMIKHMRCLTLDARPVVTFLNGEYWGVHTMRERYDSKYFDRVLGIAEGDVDMVEVGRIATLGDSLTWGALLDQVAAQDPMVQSVYEDLETKIDMDDMIDHHVSHIYVGNVDWPQNNWKAYRKRVPYTPEAPIGHDGRWRWLMFDLDWGFNLNQIHPASYDFMDWATTPFQGENNLLFRRLLRNQEYKHKFINRAADMLNTAFRPEIVTAVIDQHRDIIAQDMAEHVIRWPDYPISMQGWYSELDRMYVFGNARQSEFRLSLMDHFTLPAQHQLTVDVSSTSAGHVQVNTIEILPTTVGVEADAYPWNGIYFQTVPVTLHAHAHPGFAFSHWTGANQSTDSVITLSLTAAASVTAVFEPVPFCAHEDAHYWHFNDLPSGNLNAVNADVASSPDASISLFGQGGGSLDRTDTNDGTELNAVEGVIDGRALRARNPLQGQSLLIEAPSTGMRDVVLSFATQRTTNGPDSQQVFFTTDPARIQWTALGTAYAVNEWYSKKEFSLEGIVATYNSPDLAFRVAMSGPYASNTSGNHRFDNVRVAGRPMEQIDATVCPGGIHVHQGVVYPVGQHFHSDPTAMDCSGVILINVQEAFFDTTVTLTGAALMANASNFEYQWIDCTTMQPVADAVDQVYVPISAGTFAVQMMGNGCAVTSGCHYTPGSGPIGIMVHPIPASEQVHITLGDPNSMADYRLLDPAGRVVREGPVRSVLTTLSVSGLATGTYILHIRGTDESMDRWVKLMIE
jgi:hypothetical protein